MNNPCKFSTARIFTVLFLAGWACARAVPPPRDSDYISRLRQAVALWQQEIPSLDVSAAIAAKNLLAGGHLYLAGTQKNFIEEAVGRSGGLMLCTPLPRAVQLQPADTVLVGAISRDADPDLDALLARVSASGAHMILFSNHYRPDIRNLATFPVKKIPAGNGFRPDVGSISNIAGLWAWLGQLTTHCIRLGSMPCFYESMFMPGGNVRDKVLLRSLFHTHDIPVASEVPDFGRRYLEGLDASLARLAKVNAVSFQQAAALIMESHKSNQQVAVLSIGHMFPQEFAANPVPSWITSVPDKFVPAAGMLTLFMGYQWFPWEMPALTGPERVPSIIISSRSPTPDWVVDASHVYINPCWEVQDATIDIPGYDIKAFPVSGIMESAIFWELVERISSLNK